MRGFRRHLPEAYWKARCRVSDFTRDRKRIAIYSGGRQDWIGGPAVKINRLEEYFPNERYAFNLIYSVGATIPPDVCRWAQGRGVKVVCHVNSMNHPAYASDYAERNRAVAEIHALADHIVYGSDHARNAARRYLGVVETPHTIVYNAVDTGAFCPPLSPAERRFNVLAAGVHYLQHVDHRLLPAVRAMPRILSRYPHARLLIAGRMDDGGDAMGRGKALLDAELRELGSDRVELLGSYDQVQAPDIYRRGDVMVHLKHMDWTPNAVIEAMACGLAVVHAGNGGLPELVGGSGVSLELPADWDRTRSSDPVDLAERIMEAYERRQELGVAARKRAVELFDIRNWVEAHRLIFERLLARA